MVDRVIAAVSEELIVSHLLNHIGQRIIVHMLCACLRQRRFGNTEALNGSHILASYLAIWKSCLLSVNNIFSLSNDDTFIR